MISFSLWFFRHLTDPESIHKLAHASKDVKHTFLGHLLYRQATPRINLHGFLELSPMPKRHGCSTNIVLAPLTG
jgi:hypothetical protein